MNIFKKRPLSLILCIMLGGFSLFALTDNLTRAIFLGIALLLLLLTFTPALFNDKYKAFSRICVIAFSVSILLSVLWSHSFFPTRYFGEESKIEATVTDVKHTDSYVFVTLKSSKINGDNAKYTFSAYLFDIDERLKIGDEIKCIGTPTSLEENSTKQDKYYFYKDGISAIIEDVTDFKIVGHKNLWFRTTCEGIREIISTTFEKRTNTSAGGFMSALLIGVRDNLDKETALSFRMIGISHILALSGTHLSVITLALEKLLSLFKLHKKARIVIITLFVLFYMAISGFTPSILRSGIMLILYYALFLLARSRDCFTSLCISVALIVLILPHSIFDVSLWLSALATLGIIIAPRLMLKKDLSITKRALIWCLNVFSSSMFAIGSTVLLSALTFNNLSALSMLSTIIFTPIITVFMYASVLLLFFGGILPLGKPMIIFSNAIKEMAEAFAKPDFVYTSADYPIVIILTVVFSALVIGFLVLDVKHKRAAVIVLSVLFVSIYLFSVISSSANLKTNEAKYQVGDDDCFLLKSNSEVYLIATDDMTRKYAYYLLDTLEENRLTTLDELILTTYNATLVSNIESLIGGVKTDLIRLPYPENSSELGVARSLSKLLSGYGTTMRFYSVGVSHSLGEYDYKLLYRRDYNNGPRACVLSINTSSNKATYFSAGAYNLCDYPSLTAAAKSDTVIIDNDEALSAFDCRFPNIDALIIPNKEVVNPYVINYYVNLEVDVITVKKEYSIEKGRD